MSTRLPKKDVVVVGLGWTGSIMAYELSKMGLDVVAIERGPWRDTASDYNIATAPDELRYAVRQDIFLRPAQTTDTARNSMSQTALPIRKFGSYLPGNGVGGAGVHWNGHSWRFFPSDFNLRSHYEERYGKNFIPDDMTIQDYPVTYDELEPHYDFFEKVMGISGKAGNIKGVIQDGGNPFEGWRSDEYPTKPLKPNLAQIKFEKAAKELGLHPFPLPSANISEAYTNPYGLRLAPCTYCGFCEWFGCANYSKSSPQTCVLPALMRHTNFEARTLCEVTRINKTRDGKMASGVTYVDAAGREFEQPADIVLVCAYATFNVRLLMLSQLGTQYDPVSNTGTLGRNYAYQTNAGVLGYFDKDTHFNPFAGAGSQGMMADDYNGDNFDHAELGFVGGANINCNTPHGRPISARPTPPGTPRWGSEWKKATAETYGHTQSVGTQGSSMSYRDVYLDLDPTYKDRLGNPLMRMTFDFKENDLKMSRFVVDRCEEIMKNMGPQRMVKTYKRGPWNVVPYQTTHNTGGAVMSSTPDKGVVNRYGQHWDAPNVFVTGACLFPQNAGYNPTNTVGALTYWTLDAIKNQYLKNAGQALVQA
ncbi:GMC family oxidoreductase [Pseudoroseomonas deserti]|uniref:GMC family oxidoreductase n=1 Tax=Teichococcus deserti TaxID=1817963 RepID=A0A1V2GZB6_9PROT|nr:GMC family oxidoreductase [Pseudoroseomonas deserti]ONG50189.1 GMC family oxidoreductase [Pseudoroseomonas deserti]